jgi:ATP-dependent DNA helicase PIF1
MSLAPMNQEQSNVVSYINHTSEHVFITGKAGTGKTHVLRWLQHLSPKKLEICAPTGVAALNAGGATIHRMFGLNTGLPADLGVDISLVRRKHPVLSEMDVLVIDEVSMVSSDLLDSMDRILREVRQQWTTPFGGVQVVMFGDPYQLPPVVSKEDAAYYNQSGYDSAWFFHAHVWDEVSFQTFGLETIHRQDDAEFKDILNAVRDGTVSLEQLKQINIVGNRKITDDNAIYLGSRRDGVRDRNVIGLRKLRSPVFEYNARIQKGFGFDLPAEKLIRLKAGAHIMMISNDPQDRWVNGSRGVVASCSEDLITVRLEDGSSHTVTRQVWVPGGTLPENFKDAPKFTQMPLKLAWGMTIHKSQGLSLSEVEIDLGKGAFDFGQTYVALSRVTTPGGLFLKQPIRPWDIKVDPHVKKFFAEL